MAIIDNLGLEVKVLVSGTPAAEYQGGDFSETDDDFGAGTAKCHRYIESVDDAEFAIELSAKRAISWLEKSSNRALYFCIDVDGLQGIVRSYIDKMKDPKRVVMGVVNRETKPFTKRNFHFSPVHIGTFYSYKNQLQPAF